jgi:hypothetical protein
MFNVDNGIYDAKYSELQDNQQVEVAACRDFYTEVNVDRISVLSFDEVEEPLERSRIYGPFTLDVVYWVKQFPFVKLLVDADGRECIEY